MDVVFLLVLIFLVPGILWYISMALLSNWKYFKLFFVLNAILVVGYSLYLIYADLPFIGHDEYGIQRLLYVIFVPIIHIVLIFLLAFFIKWRCKTTIVKTH